MALSSDSFWRAAACCLVALEAARRGGVLGAAPIVDAALPVELPRLLPG